MSMTTLNHSKKITHAIEMLNNAAKEKKEEIAQNITRLGKTAQKAVYQGGRTVKKAAIKVDKKVHENPWAVIGGVAAGALLMGFLMGKVKRK